MWHDCDTNVALATVFDQIFSNIFDNFSFRSNFSIQCVILFQLRKSAVGWRTAGTILSLLCIYVWVGNLICQDVFRPQYQITFLLRYISTLKYFELSQLLFFVLMKSIISLDIITKNMNKLKILADFAKLLQSLPRLCLMCDFTT